MLRLILDPIRRWWWVHALVLFTAIMSAFVGSPFLLLAPVGVVLLFIDAQGGLIRATAPLPVTRSAQARARWIFAVPLLAIAGAASMWLGAGLREILFPRASSAMFGVVIQTWLGLGYAGFAFIGLSFVGSRPPETWREHFIQILVGLCWGGSVASLGWLYPPLPRKVADMQQWHLNLLIAVPFLVAFSYLSSEEFIRRRSVPPGGKAAKPARPQKSEMEGLSGIPLYLLSIPGRVIVFTLFMASIQWLTLGFTAGQWTSYINVGLFQFAIFGMFISTFVTEQVSIRALRALPLSVRKLTLLLLSGPCVSALGIALLWIPEVLQQGLSLAAFEKMAEMVLFVAGCGTLCIATVLRYVGLGRLVVIVALAVAAPFALLFLPKIPGAAAACGVITGIAGYFLLNHSLRHCSATYQPRKLFGVGMMQPQ